MTLRLLSAPHLALGALLMSAALAGCDGGGPADPQPDRRIGVWTQQGDTQPVMVLEGTQRWHLLGVDDLQGQRWQTDSGDAVTLTGRVPSSDADWSHQATLTLDAADRLSVSGVDVLDGTWLRDDSAAWALDGQLDLAQQSLQAGDRVELVLEPVTPPNVRGGVLQRESLQVDADTSAQPFRLFLLPRQSGQPDRRLVATVYRDDKPVLSASSTTLKDRQPDPVNLTLLPLAAPLHHGEYHVEGDRAWFHDCQTDQDYALADNGGAEDVRQQWDGRRQADGSLLASVRGVLVDGTLHITQALDMRENGRCAQRTEASLTNTYWKLTQLDGAKLPGESASEPHLVLAGAEDDGALRAHGSLGCNRFFAAYELGDQHALRFAGVGATMMACIDGMATEQRYRSLFEQVRSYRLEGELLRLFDDQQNEIALFQSVYLF
ncbi:META domain-containing protein [Isoalcanivorax beigongshangi]|uniref:META domain-containing protein n=1 Tax=Isoalcanivorax beigongshangi TaxID=3238810 RepID=A0ABV4AE74_9GAMM